MAEFTARDRAVGQWVLAVMFAIAAIAAAWWSWRLIRLEGLTLRSVIWLLALLGFISLTWRSARAATLAGRGTPTPRA
ncbi:MAG TPA: hypothetical protein VJ650_10990 [Gemmatimonadaceae bacterium]|nr:hypothetical protein [Gemmatimonadaceae bacterium]